MSNIKNCQLWESLFNTYNELDKDTVKNINKINEIKNNLTKLLGNQSKDDIHFYKSIIDNSHFYLDNSIKIRKTKFLRTNSLFDVTRLTHK